MGSVGLGLDASWGVVVFSSLFSHLSYLSDVDWGDVVGSSQCSQMLLLFWVYVNR